MGQYRVGTASVTNGDATVTFSGTALLTYAAAGDSFKLSGVDAVYSVASVTDDTHLELTIVWAGSTLAAQNYQIGVDWTPNNLFQEIWAGDRDWPFHLTMTLRAMDALVGPSVSPTLANLTISGLTASLPVFTNASKMLVSNAMTGTGSVVMSTSPTFVTQITTPQIVATAASLVLKPTTDAVTAIQLSDKDGNAILTVDTTNNRITTTDLITTGPWVDVRAYASINAAVAAIGATPTVLLVPNTQTLTASLTIPSTLALKIEKGGSIVKASTYTLTINGPFEAGLYQVFSGFGINDVVLGAGSAKTFYPQWWGATGSRGLTEIGDIIPVQASINAASTIGAVVYFSEGTYVLANVLLKSNTHLRGSGAKSILKLITNATGASYNGGMVDGSGYYPGNILGTTLRYTGHDGVTDWYDGGVRAVDETNSIYIATNITIKDLKFDGNKANNTLGDLGNNASVMRADLNLNQVSDVLVDNCIFTDGPLDGIFVGYAEHGGSDRVTIQNGYFSGNVRCGIAQTTGKYNSFINNMIYHSGTGAGIDIEANIVNEVNYHHRIIGNYIGGSLAVISTQLSKQFDCIISDNTLSYLNIYLQQASGSLISGNIFQGSGTESAIVYGCSGYLSNGPVSVVDNTFINYNKLVAAKDVNQNAHLFVFSNNNIYSVTPSGSYVIELQRPYQVTISNNKFFDVGHAAVPSTIIYVFYGQTGSYANQGRLTIEGNDVSTTNSLSSFITWVIGASPPTANTRYERVHSNIIRATLTTMFTSLDITATSLANNQHNSKNISGTIAFGSYTDGSNYEYGSLTQTAGFLTIAAQTAGTGTDNIDLTLTPAGTGKINLGSKVSTDAESWIGPSTTTGLYFKGGFAGFGTITPGAVLELNKTSGGTGTTKELLRLVSIGQHAIGDFFKSASAYSGLALLSGGSMNFGLDHDNNNTGTRFAWFNNLGVADDLSVATPLMVLLETGNVGINTTAPDALLELNMGTDKQFRMSYNDANGSATDYTKMEVGSNGNLTITTVDSDGTSGHIALMPDGNVGIGTVAPGSKLHVYNSAAYGTSEMTRWENFISSNSTTVTGYLNFTSANGSYSTLNLTQSYGNISFGGNTNGDTLTQSLFINTSGNVGIGTVAPNQKLTVEGSISLVDQAAAAADTAGYGQIWVSNATPDELWFTDDAGTDTQVSSHPQDAPAALYTNGPGLDWIGKRVQKYLGVIFWQQLNGTITEETFEAYNLRRKNSEGHTDLVKRDWDTVQLAKLREAKLAEVIETEVITADAFESVEIMKDVQTGTKSEGFTYTVDKDGKVAVTEKTSPIMTKQGTGEYEKKLKTGIAFNDKTGKFLSKRTMTEAEVDALNLKAPKMPDWMDNWLKTKDAKNE